ncbi:MAG: peptidylprolyl isomerase [Halobacteriovorax sp.]|nr:peptidylprolyl isomerase [Halobacteriovorax sp.]
MKKTALMVLGLISTSGLVGCKKDFDHTPSSEDEKALYTYGALLAQRVNPQQLQLTEGEMQSLVQGLWDNYKGNKERVAVADYRMKVQEVLEGRFKKAIEGNKAKGSEFLEKFVKEEDAKKTESGLAYKILKAGEGASPKPDDVVKVHYTGTLIDGTVFDSSRESGKELEIPLNRVIKGWTEGLQMIAPGGQIKLVIPAELGYGSAGAGTIPPESTLVFDVELIEVMQPEAKAKK